MTDQSHNDDVMFLQLVSMFQVAAMQQMGKLVNPVTNETEKNMEQARVSIDMLEMLQRKTEGQRSDAESTFLEKVLFELRMNYVEESAGKEDRPSGKDAPESTGAQPSENPDDEKE